MDTATHDGFIADNGLSNVYWILSGLWMFILCIQTSVFKYPISVENGTMIMYAVILGIRMIIIFIGTFKPLQMTPKTNCIIGTTIIFFSVLAAMVITVTVGCVYSNDTNVSDLCWSDDAVSLQNTLIFS